ncbi:MAG: CpaF family protein, partial [Actinobacteria bacterium]|nr:CpaF family protein [Actinomycetota bacterium]
AQSFITPTIATSIDLVVQCSIDKSGKRRVVEIAAVTGRCEGGNIEVENLFKWNSRGYEKGLGNLSSLLKKRNQ